MNHGHDRIPRLTDACRRHVVADDIEGRAVEKSHYAVVPEGPHERWNLLERDRLEEAVLEEQQTAHKCADVDGNVLGARYRGGDTTEMTLSHVHTAILPRSVVDAEEGSLVDRPPLFPEPTTPRTRGLRWSEPWVNWIVESTSPAAVTARSVTNGWYAHFPDGDGKFAARLRSATDTDHLQATDELFVHHLLRTRHADVRYEEGGVGPDFRIYADGLCIAAVEVASVFQQAEWTAEARPHQRLADELNTRVRPSAGYFVSFDIEVADREPSPRKFAEFVRRTVEDLPPPEELKLPSAPGSDDLPSATYTADGVQIRVRFMPMYPDAPARTDPDGRIVGMGATIGGFVATTDRLKDRVSDKAGSRYDIAAVPFLVVVGVHEAICDDFNVLSALYGGTNISLAGEIRRRNDGLFGVDPKPPTDETAESQRSPSFGI